MSRHRRREQLRALMDEQGLGALLIRTPANFAWYTDGGDNRVDHSSAIGVAEVIVTRDRDVVFTNSIEARRMHDEQVTDMEIADYPWYEDPWPYVRKLVGSVPIGSDAPIGDARDVAAAIQPLRWVLDEDAQMRYRAVGRDTEAAMAEAASKVTAGMTEMDAAAELAYACRRRDLFSPVILAAADDRITTYRHPLPTRKRVRRRLMLVVCGERGGLFANMTQFVHLEEPDPALRARFEACERILDRMRQEATRPGRTLADAFADCTRYYADEGYPGEWTLHHQGGSTGYASREVVATPYTRVKIETGQAFAWNPSITGAKTEETFMLTENGPEILARGKFLP